MTIGLVSFIIAVVAFILATPLNIAANIMTPKIQDWLSHSSLKRTQRQVEKLQRQLRLVETLHADRSKLIAFVGFRVLDAARTFGVSAMSMLGSIYFFTAAETYNVAPKSVIDFGHIGPQWDPVLLNSCGLFTMSVTSAFIFIGVRRANLAMISLFGVGHIDDYRSKMEERIRRLEGSP